MAMTTEHSRVPERIQAMKKGRPAMKGRTRSAISTPSTACATGSRASQGRREARHPAAAAWPRELASVDGAEAESESESESEAEADADADADADAHAEAEAETETETEAEAASDEDGDEDEDDDSNVEVNAGDVGVDVGVGIGVGGMAARQAEVDRACTPRPLAASARSTASGVAGASRTRAPVAWWIALRMAAAVGTSAGSPMPLAP